MQRNRDRATTNLEGFRCVTKIVICEKQGQGVCEGDNG